MDVTPGLRRIPPADIDEVGEERDLVGRIRDEILAHGPMTFARFMQLALYDPELGYYRGASARPGRAGDFLTAPESHPIFGWTLARQLTEIWRLLGRPARFTVREHGAGTGALAKATLDGLQREGSPLLEAIEWQPVEVEPGRVRAFDAGLRRAGHDGRIGEADNRAFTGVVLGNEVLDAMPVHRVLVRHGRLREVLVGWTDDGFFDIEADPTTAALAHRLADEEVDLIEGQRAEINLGLDQWTAAAVAGLERGVLLLIDYGYPARELYDPIRRSQGTLLGYVRHSVHDNPYQNVGRQDLTVHVDVTAVERAAEAAGLVSLGVTTQAEFLAALGAGELLRALQDLPETTLQSYLEARAALGRMLDPAVAGRFRVMVFARGLPPDPILRGLQRGYGERPIAPTHHGSAGSDRPG